MSPGCLWPVLLLWPGGLVKALARQKHARGTRSTGLWSQRPTVKIAVGWMSVRRRRGQGLSVQWVLSCTNPEERPGLGTLPWVLPSPSPLPPCCVTAHLPDKAEPVHEFYLLLLAQSICVVYSVLYSKPSLFDPSPQ